MPDPEAWVAQSMWGMCHGYLVEGFVSLLESDEVGGLVGWGQLHALTYPAQHKYQYRGCGSGSELDPDSIGSGFPGARGGQKKSTKLTKSRKK